MEQARATWLPALAGAATVAAGLVHAAAAGAHPGDPDLAVLFAATAAVQLALGMAALLRPRRTALAAATLVNLAAAGVWGASRLAGLPMIESLHHRQAVGLQDGMAVLAEVVAVVAAGQALRSGLRPAAFPAASPVLALAVVPALVGMTASHSHPEEHAHGEEAEGMAADPLFSGLDTSHATEDQLEAARALIVSTRSSVSQRFPDEAAVMAAGYRSIGDGRVRGSFEHFVNADYLADGRELDPQRIESIVLENTGAGPRVASAMYILEMGKTMDDVPEVAGELTVWHDHQNLCWDDAGVRLAGLLVNGRCLPRGTFRPTPPMLHVWVQDHPCGPFAGIDGHGQGCAHRHGD
ncbi:MAG: hypothetical protein ACLGI2_05535 [Acidimicrobiia bacterium]